MDNTLRHPRRWEIIAGLILIGFGLGEIHHSLALLYCGSIFLLTGRKHP